MQEFTCAKVGDTEWAAARVSPGDTAFSAVRRHQMEHPGLPEHLRHRSAGLPQWLLPTARPPRPRRRRRRPPRLARPRRFLPRSRPAPPCRSSPAPTSVASCGPLRVLTRATPSSSCGGTAPNGTPGLPERLRHRLGGPAPVAPVLLQGRPVLVADDAGHPPLARPRRFLPRSRPAPQCRSSPAPTSVASCGPLRVLARATPSSSCGGTAANGTPRTPRASAAPHRRACPSRSCPTASSPGERSVLRQRPIRSAMSPEQPVDEVPAGIGELRAYKPGEKRDRDWRLSLASHKVTVRIVGNVARTEIDETFQQRHRRRARGHLPLPAAARRADRAARARRRRQDGRGRVRRPRARAARSGAA